MSKDIDNEYLKLFKYSFSTVLILISAVPPPPTLLTIIKSKLP